MKPKILIIDDHQDRGRKKVYSDVLQNQFELSFVESGASVYNDIENSDPALYLIDIVLSGWKDPRKDSVLEIYDVLRAIRNKKPIILVSNEYENLVKQKKLTPLMNEIIGADYNVTEFILWNDFAKALDDKSYMAALTNKINLQIAKYNKTRQARTNASIGIIAALELELAPFLANIDENSTEEHVIGNTRVIKGFLKTRQGKYISFVAARQHGMGMVESAFLSALLVNNFKIQHLFMIGVCGGRQSAGIKIGDLIIPNECVAYQNGKLTDKGLQPDFGYAQCISGLSNMLLETYWGPKLMELRASYEKDFFDRNGRYLGVEAPKLVCDPMACGDYIIDKKDEIEKIAEDTKKRKLCAVEMESYSVLKVPQLFSTVKATVLKAVMDLTNDKNDKYKHYAAFISANFLYELLVDEVYKIEE